MTDKPRNVHPLQRGKTRQSERNTGVTMKYRNVGMAKVALITCVSLALVGCAGVTQLLQGEAGQQAMVAAPDQTSPSSMTLETQGRTGAELTLGLGAPPLAINIGRGRFVHPSSSGLGSRWHQRGRNMGNYREGLQTQRQAI